jgi:alpha-1,2-mannosyltransferase
VTESVGPLTGRERGLLLGLGALYAVVVVILRLGHTGDVAHEIALSDRLLRGEPLYGVTPQQGSLWPPFASLAMVPFALIARLSLPAAAAAWSVFGVACLVATLALARRWGWQAALLALLATAMPVQTNFEHRNVNTVLLLLIVAGAVDLDAGRERRAGAWFGLAAALKAFPALLLVYLALRRSWRALGAGVAVAVGATLLPLVPYGPAGAVEAIDTWLNVGLDQGQWQLAASDQSLRALVLRLGGSPALAAAAAVLLIAGLAAALAARRAAKPLDGVGATTLAAVLAAPVAWVHYFVLAFPAWVALLGRPRGGKGTSPLQQAAVWLAAIATSGWLTMGQGPLRRALHAANLYTWGTLLLLLLLATRRSDSHPETG